ncbi:hypothetical protein BRC83_03225 [Halobacteriales archaeon QS_1_68_17]|nr:MAG: hypothetical protein BRC83_03225 [Halobacteriales archaeon QS_1_68_17]
MSTGTEEGVVAAIRIDLQRMHETWMELIYPRQVDADQTVLGKWQPTTGREEVTYRTWALLGVPVVAVVYPLVLLGFLIRFQSRRLDSTATRLGVLGVVLLSLVVWGGLTAVARLRFSTGGFLAVLAASLVATVAAALAVVFGRVGGRGTTVLFAYPFGVTALFLPPVVAALYSPALADVVFPRSTSIAIWLLDNVLTVGGLNEIVRRQYDLRGVAYPIMWFGLAVPVGWFLGVVVTLADLVRPK